MEKFLLFANGGGGSDPLNWSQDEAILLSSSNLISIRPTDLRTLQLTFTSAVIDLTIKNGSHVSVMQSIAASLNSNQSLITIANKDSQVFVHEGIVDVEINPSINTYVQSLGTNSRTIMPVPRGKIKNCMIANTDGSAAVACTLELSGNGSTFTKIIDQLSIPAKSTLVLEQNEISFDDTTLSLYGTSGDSDGQLTFTFNY